jgi:hypothetical protein
MLAVFSLTLVLSLLCVAQQSTTSLHGTVTDPKGAVVPNTSVTLSNPDTGFTRTEKTNEEGVYQFLQIAPGKYNVQAQAPGFASTKKNDLRLLVNSPTTFNVMLRVAESQTTVEVTSDVPLVNTQDATLGNAFGTNQIQSLPFEGRDPVGILSLQPGVAYVGNNVDQGFDSRGGAVNGARSDQTNVTLDGVDDNDQLRGFAFQGALRSTLDSLQEFRVTTSNSNADAGRSSGAQVTLLTKSGTNKIHGTLYEYHRPTFTTANDWFNKQAQLRSGQENRAGKLLRNTFGGSIGGPIVKNRLFFFATYEGQRTRETTQVTRTIPSEFLRQGIIRYRTCADGTTSCSAGDPTQIVTLTPADLAGMDPGCAANGTCPLGAGANPAVTALWQTYPLPNNDQVGDGLNFRGFTFAANTPTKLDTYIAKIDYNLTENGNHRLFVRGNLQNDHSVPANANAAEQFPGQEPNETRTDNSKGIAVGYIATLSSTLVNNFRYGYVRQGTGRTGPNQEAFNDFRGLDEPIGFNFSNNFTVPVHNFVDDITWTKGKHTIQTGANWRLVHNNRFSNRQNFFNGFANVSWLDNASIANSGSSLDPGAFGFPAVADFFSSDYDVPMNDLAGLMTQITSQYNQDKNGNIIPEGSLVPRHFKNNELEFYLQDSWRVKPSFTMTLGVRYTLLQPPYETTGTQVAPSISLDQWFKNRAKAMDIGETSHDVITLDLSGQANGKQPYWDWDYRNLAPRIAFAWSPSADSGFFHKLFGSAGKSSIRAGYGIYYDHFGQGVVNTFDTQGSFGLTTSIVNPAGIQSVDTAPRFASETVIPTAGASGPVVSPPPGLFPVTPPQDLDFGFAIAWGLDNKLKTPYSHVFDLSYTRELPGNFVFEAAYVGRLGRHLLQEQDIAMPLNLRDPKSGVDYFTAATEFAKMAENGVPIDQVQPIAYWENIFPSAAGPNLLSGNGAGTVPCAPGTAPANATATQNMYDNFFCNLHNETTALFFADLLCFPGCASINGGPPTPNVFFDDQYSSLYAWTSNGNSSYHAGQFMLRRAMSNGLQFDFNYTLSQSIDLSSNAERINIFEADSNFGGTGGQIINTWSPRQLRGPSDYDTRHQINTNWVWELPYGKGRHWASNGGVVGAVFGDWQLAGVGRWTSGYPFSISPGLGNWPTNWELTGNAFLTGEKPKTGTFIDENGDPNVFKDPNQANSMFRFAHPGESGQRNVLRGPGYFGVDAGLSKVFRITESQALRFSWETFNIFNSVRFDVATMSFNNGSLTNASNFGKYTSTITKPRAMQFALRYNF